MADFTVPAGPSQIDPLTPEQRELLDDAEFNHARRLEALHVEGIAAAGEAHASIRMPDATRSSVTGLAAGAAGLTAAAVAGAAVLADTPVSRFRPGRRTVLAGAGATALAAAVAAPARASAASVVASPAVDEAIMRRVSFGLNGELEADVAARGGWLGWIDAQIAGGIADPFGNTVDAWMFTRNWTAQQCNNWWAPRVASGSQASITEAHATFGMFRAARFLIRAAYSKQQLAERMIDFWFNRFNIPATGDMVILETEYDALIRKYSMTSFYQLLSAVTTSKSMMTFLNAIYSTKTTLNENLGRELLELHTVGVDHYTEADVRDSARLLTGWTARRAPDFARYYVTSAHSTGTVKIMGFTHPNSNPDGRPVLQAYLYYLAHHPLTAQRLAHDLIQYFCNDTPDPTHVAAVAHAYGASNTDIKTTLRALFHHPAFATYGGKMANPLEDFLSVWRLRGTQPIAPTWKYGNPDSAVQLATRFPHAMVSMARLAGRQPCTWQTPDGFPIDSRRYQNAGSILTMFDTHQWLSDAVWHPGYVPGDWCKMIGFTAPMQAVDVVEKIARYVWRQSADDGLRSAAQSIWALSDLTTTISPSDQRGTTVWAVAGVAFNHPLMMTR